MLAKARPVDSLDPGGSMNGLERAFAQELERRCLAGEIASWRFQPLRLILAPATTYCPDFQVILPDGRLELVEVKGFWRDDARVKVKLAAALFPEFGFVAVQRRKAAWSEERF